MHEIEVYPWREIADEHSDALILGNGASIAFDSRFVYSSLSEEAFDREFITDDLLKIFKHLDTHDFELVMRVLWHASKVNEVLGIQDQGQTQAAYTELKLALIRTIREIHVSYPKVQDRLLHAARYMRRFRTVLSLNYDLLVYWASLVGNGDSKALETGHRFKDCFFRGDFQFDWQAFREVPEEDQTTTLFFFPHGNLALGIDFDGIEFKISRKKESLLETVLKTWEAGEATPLFVSEGTRRQKFQTIQRSAYLSTVYEEVLPGLGDGLTCFGWSMSEEDEHLLEAVAKGQPERIAVSVLLGHENPGAKYAHVHGKLEDKLSAPFQLTLFDAESPGCWIHP